MVIRHTFGVVGISINHRHAGLVPTCANTHSSAKAAQGEMTQSILKSSVSNYGNSLKSNGKTKLTQETKNSTKEVQFEALPPNNSTKSENVGCDTLNRTFMKVEAVEGLDGHRLVKPALKTAGKRGIDLVLS